MYIYMHMNQQLYTHDSYLLCGFMTAHRFYFCLLFVLDRIYVSSLWKFIWCILLILWKSQHTSLFLGSIFQILFLLAVSKDTTKFLRLQVDKYYIHTSYSQQMTKVFRKLLVYTNLFCTKSMLGINMHYLHMHKYIHIHFSLIFSMFYKYYT